MGLVAAAGAARAEEAAIAAPGDPPLFARFRVALDEVVERARPDGGWVFGALPGERVHPHTDPLQFAEKVAKPFGLNDWDLVVMRSPGTPAAILALLRGHRLLGDDRYRDAAMRAGDLVVALQMRTGGWFSEMPAEGPHAAWWFTAGIRRTAIDDDVTPGAIRALLALFEVTGDARYRVAAERGVAFLLDRQLPGGAWPLVARPRWKQLVWTDFEDRPTLNDGATTQSLVTLLMAARVLERPSLVAAARRAGDWIVHARHPEPQPAWAQQYDEQGTPVSARRYERVALASWETRYAIDALVELAAATGDAAYCAPVGAAARWLARSEIAPGCWARFYELHTNVPLYFNERREAVGTPTEAHQPYDWTGNFGISDLLRRLRGEPQGDEPGTPVPGDPGQCPNPTARPFDPTTATDPRQVIAWAGRIGESLVPRAAPPPACLLR
jgi:hypothetical protein